MNKILFAQIFIIVLLFVSILLFSIEYVRYKRYNRIFSKDYLSTYKKNRLRKYYPFIPKYKSIKYNKASSFLIKVGWDISVESLYVYKWLLFLIGITLAMGIQITNQYMFIDQIKKDINYNKIIIDDYVEQTQQAVKLEIELYDYVNMNLDKNTAIFKKQHKNMYLEYIANLLLNNQINNDESVENISKRLFEKIRTIRVLEGNLGIFLWGLLVSVLLYCLPDFMGFVKIKLIEDKKDWEVIHCIYTFSIFGRLVPYSVKQVLECMSIISTYYKPLLNCLLEGIKKGTSSTFYDDILEKVDNEDMYELIETMKLASNTGVLNSVEDMDVLAEQKLKWMEIKGIERREQKKLYAMTFVAIMFLLGGIYFSYGLTIIANPSNMIPK